MADRQYHVFAMGFVVAVIVYISTGEDMTWMYVSWGLATVVVLGLHLAARGKGAEAAKGWLY